MDEDTRKQNMKTVSGFLTQQHTTHDYKKRSFRRITSGRYVIFGYLVGFFFVFFLLSFSSQVLKLLFALNAAVQFMMMKSILGVDTYNWGWDVATNLYNGVDWEETGNFPR